MNAPRVRARIRWSEWAGYWIARCGSCDWGGAIIIGRRWDKLHCLPYAHDLAARHVRLWHTDEPMPGGAA